MAVDLRDVEVGVVVLWSVHLFGWVDEGVDFEADSLYIKVCDVEDVVL